MNHNLGQTHLGLFFFIAAKKTTIWAFNKQINYVKYNLKGELSKREPSCYFY